MGFLVHCSLDSPILFFNIYRHPNTNTLSHVYNSLFDKALSARYSLIVGDFNAYHQAWRDARNDKQGEYIFRSADDHQLIILNDGAATFLSSSGPSSSTIDLSIFSRDLGLLASVSTSKDLCGSDHFPVSIVISDTSPSSFRFSHKLKFNDLQLTSLHFNLSAAYPHFNNLAASFTSSSNPLAAYDFLYSFLLNSISSLFSSGLPPPGKRAASRCKNPAPW